jgi:hypothetical protein
METTAPSILNEETPKAPEGAPEKYTDWKLPEGMEFVEGQREAVETLFKDSNLNQETGQKFLDFYHENIKKAQANLIDFYVKKQDEWRAEIKNDPTIGPRVNEIKANFSRALDATVGAEKAAAFKQIMDYTGAGNSPAFVRVMDVWSKMLTEGKHVEGGQPSPAGQRLSGQPRPTAAQAMYPNLPT